MLRTVVFSLSVCCLAVHAATAQSGARTARASAPTFGTAADTQPEALYRELTAAVVRRDTAAASRILAADYFTTTNSPGSTVSITRAERLRQIAGDRGPTAGVDSATVDQCTIHTYGAFAVGPCRLITYARGSHDRAAHVMAVVLFTRGRGGRWQIRAVHMGTLAESQ